MQFTVRGPAAQCGRKAAASSPGSALALALSAVLLVPFAVSAANPAEEGRQYLRAAPGLLTDSGSLPTIDAAAVLAAIPDAPEADELRWQLAQATPENSEASLARLIALNGTPLADEIAARAWLTALHDGTTGFAEGWTGADPIILARAVEVAADRPVEVLYEDADGAVSSIYALLLPQLRASLASIQHPDGAFGFADEPADIAATAEVALALGRLETDTQASAIAAAARGWLTAQAQAPDGLSAADLAFLLLTADADPAVADALLSALEARQWPDGSFDGDVRSTALAIRALTQHLPNVAVEVPANVQTQVGQNQPLTVAVRVRNTSVRPVPATELAYRLTDSAGGLAASGAVPVPAMIGAESRSVALTLTGPAALGTYTLELIANPDSTFAEARWDDNVARLHVKVTAPADLILEPIDITMIPNPPLLYETTRFTVRVRNVGETPAENVHVQLFSGDPSAGGVLLGATVLNMVAPGVPRSLDVNFTPKSLDPLTLFARLDPANSVVESDETNNATSLTVTPKSPAEFQSDFRVYSMTPASGSKVAQGEPATVKAMFHFLPTRFGQPQMFVGVREAWPFTTVPVALYQDFADGTSTLVRKSDVDLLKPSGSDTTLAVYEYTYDLPRDAAAGNYRFRFLVDPDATRPEIDRSNNSIATEFELTNSGVAELLFDAGSVRADSPIVDTAHPTVVRGRVRNIGLATAINVPVQYRAPKRTFVATIPSLAPGEAVEVAEAVTLADVTGGWDVVLTIDPTSTIPESTKANNSATATLSPTQCAIAFTSVTPTPDPSPGGASASLRIDAFNNGYTTLAGFRARARIGGTWIGDTIFRQETPVGSSVQVSLPVSLVPFMSGDETATVELLPWSTWPPQNGPTVGTEVTVRIRRPDLAVATRGIALEKTFGPQGEELLVPTVTIDNLGGLPATSSVRLYRGYASAGDLIEAGTIEVQAGGAAIYRGGPFAPPSAPPYVVTVVLDRENAIPELDEENNVATRPVEKNLGDVVVAFEETHGPTSTVGLNPDANAGAFTGDHADWAADLEAHGYVVTTLNPDTQGFTPAKLRGVDVLVGTTSVIPMTPAELDLLQEFVERGGGYFLMGEWGSTIYDLAWREWEQGVASRFGLAPLQERVGKVVQCGGPCQTFQRTDGLVLAHPVTDGVDRVFGALTGGFSVVPPGATVLVKSGAYPWSPTDTAVLGVLELGAGRVGFTGEGTLADASITDCGALIGCGIASPYYSANNRRLVRQMIDWLANGGPGDFPADLAIAPAAVRLSNPDPIAGELVRVAVTVRNVGGASTTLGPTTVRFFDGPEADGRILAEVQVPDLPVDQAFEAFFDWDTSLEGGLHTLTAVVDPDHLIVERLEDNNSASVEVRVRGRHDLRVDPSDIAIASGSPQTVSVRVHNVGYAAVPAGVPLRLKIMEGGATRDLAELALPEVPARGAVGASVAWIGEFPEGAFKLVAEVDPADTLRDPDRGTNAASIDVSPPELAVHAPAPGIVWGGSKVVRWIAKSALRPKLNESVAIAPKGGSFTGLGGADGSLKLDTKAYADGEYVLRLTADDGLQRTVREVPFTVANAGLALRTFAGAESWTSSGGASVATLKIPAGSRVVSATALLDADGSQGVNVGAGMAANLRGGTLLRFRGVLHFIAIQDDTVRDWTSDDDGATWKPPVALSLAGTRAQACAAAANAQAIHVAYLPYETDPRLLLATSFDGAAWVTSTDWGRMPSSAFSLTSTDDGLAAIASGGKGLYVATADAVGSARSPVTYVAIGNAVGASMAIRVGGRLRIAFVHASSAVDPLGTLAYTEVPIERYADAAAYSPPVALAGIPSGLALNLVGDQIDLAYTSGQYQLYQRCTVGDECTFRDRWLPEAASNGWDAYVLTLTVDHGTAGHGTASAWKYGADWYAARSIRDGAQWGDWEKLGVTLPGESNGGMLFEEEAICGAGNILAKFNFACWPLLSPSVQTLDVGGEGTIEAASRREALGTAETADLAEALNAWLAGHADADDGTTDGQVAIPLHVKTMGAGSTVLRNLEVRYVPSAEVAGFATPPVFSPGASPGVLDATLFSLLSPSPVAIYSATGADVRSLAVAPSGSRWVATFDGRDASGVVLPSGRYGFGAAGVVAGEVEIDDIPPTAVLQDFGGAMGGAVLVSGVASDANFEGVDRNFASYALEWSADGVSWLSVAAGSRPASGILGQWNTAGVTAKVAQLRLTVMDRAGNSAVAVRSVSLDPAAPPPPIITGPTVTGRPLDVAGSVVEVAGTGPSGTTVRVYRNGTFVGETQCDGAWTLGTVELPSGISTFTARTLRGGIESGDAAPIVVARYALQVGVSGPADVERPGETTATISVARTSAVGGPLKVALSVTDIAGAEAPIASSPAEVLVSPTNEGPATFEVRVASAEALPGTYRLRASVTEGGLVPATGSSLFAVTASDLLTARLVSDRAVYGASDPIELTATIQNASAAGDAIGLTVLIDVRDPAGAVRSLEPLPLGDLASGRFVSRSVLLEGSPWATGTHQATLLVMDSFGTVRATASGSFDVVADAPSLGLSGTLAVAPPEYRRGVPVQGSFTVANGGGSTTNVAASVLLTDVVTGAVVARVDGTRSVTAGETWTGMVDLPTPMDSGDLLALLVANGRTLAAAAVPLSAWADVTPPEIDISGVADGDYRNGAVLPVVQIVDESSFTATQTMDGAPFIEGTLISNEGTHTLAVSAVDAWGNASGRSVAFVIDTTPPEITVAGVTEGGAQPAPVSPTFGATDDNLDGQASASLDGAPFESGTTIGAAGDHVLVVTASDLAGNVSVRSVAFTLTADESDVGLDVGPDAGPRVLVGLGCLPASDVRDDGGEEDDDEDHVRGDEGDGQHGDSEHAERAGHESGREVGEGRGHACNAEEARFLRNTLDSASIPYELAAGGEAFQKRLRAHWHDVRILYRFDASEHPSLAELREATWAGGGLVIVLAGGSDADPKLGDAAGLHVRGTMEIDGQTTVSVGNRLGLSSPPTLAGRAGRQRLEGATPALLTFDGEAIVSTRQYGAGRVVTISFDPEANATRDVADLLLRSVRWAGSGSAVDPVAGVPYFAAIGVTAPSGAASDLRLVATLPQGLELLAAPGATSVAPPTWLFTLGGGERTARALVLKTPWADQPPVDVLLSAADGTGWRDLAASTLTVPRGPDVAHLRAGALEAIASMAVRADEREGREKALDEIRAVPENPKTGADAAEAIRAALRAVDRLRELRTDVDAARRATDALLRALEVRSLTTP